MSTPSPSEIRQSFALALSEMFATEVPEYTQFTEIVKQSNEHFLRTHPTAIVDKENRVLAEKHGAIRVGTAYEMRVVTRIFSVMGMFPVEFYDLTQLPKGALPMIATAFRPIDESIETSAFRMFCSMLHPDYIEAEIKPDVDYILAARNTTNTKFSKKLYDLLDLADAGSLSAEQAAVFVTEVVHAFRIQKDRPVSFKLYQQLRLKNDVFADIVCLGININHLTPRAYDIMDAQKRLESSGIPMKDGGIEGPPIREDAPAIQLNQTSRKAPGEPLYVSNAPEVLTADDSTMSWDRLKKDTPHVTLRDNESVQDYLQRIDTLLQNNKLVVIDHKARFGEIEARGVALTVKGEALYKALLAEKRFKSDFPKTHLEMFEQELAYYTFDLVENGRSVQLAITADNNGMITLIKAGVVHLVPQTYNDFLAASAAGIFKSNMSTGVTGIDTSVHTETSHNKALLENAMGRVIISRHDLHRAAQERSRQLLLARLHLV